MQIPMRVLAHVVSWTSDRGHRRYGQCVIRACRYGVKPSCNAPSEGKVVHLNIKCFNWACASIYLVDNATPCFINIPGNLEQLFFSANILLSNGVLYLLWSPTTRGSLARVRYGATNKAENKILPINKVDFTSICSWFSKYNTFFSILVSQLGNISFRKTLTINKSLEFTFKLWYKFLCRQYFAVLFPGVSN